MKYRRAVWALALTAVAAGGWWFTDFYYRPQPVEHKAEGFVYDNISSFGAAASVSFRGQIERSIFGADVFRGSLEAGELRYNFVMKKEANTYFGFIHEKGEREYREYSELETSGTVYASGDLDRIWLKLQAWDELYGLQDAYFAAPAAERGQALAVARELAERP